MCDECENNPEKTLNKTVRSILSYMCIIDERLNRQGDNIENMR